MPKLFRKNRKKFFLKKKFKRYLLYAFGELALIVLGILIAVSVNQCRESIKSEKKIDILLHEVLEELSYNIENANYGINFFLKQDSSFQLVRQNKLTEEYISTNLDDLIDLSTHYNYGTFRNNGYNNLIRNLDIIPDDYRSVLKQLDMLYGSTTRFVYKYNDLIEEFSINTLNNRANNYEWFSSLEDAESKKCKINFILNDYKYKNEIENLHTITYIHGLYLEKYREKSIIIYNEIANLLDVPELDIHIKKQI